MLSVKRAGYKTALRSSMLSEMARTCRQIDAYWKWQSHHSERYQLVMEANHMYIIYAAHTSVTITASARTIATAMHAH